MLRKIGFLLVLVTLILVYYWRFLYSSSFARSWDQVDFALALGRFDLLAMQPHFPGYPYFILGGMFFHQWVADPAKALSMFNVFMSLLATIPIYLLARKRLTPLMSALFTLWIQTVSFLWIISTQPMSEGTAIAILWWYLWSLCKGFEKGTIWVMLLPLFFFGLLMGIRFSYLIFGLGIVLLWIYDWKRYKGSDKEVTCEKVAYQKVTYQKMIYQRRLSLLIFFAVVFQLTWVTALVLSEGSLSGFIQLSLAFIDGHFNDWGGAATASDTNLWSRFLTLVFHNLFWVGLFGRSIPVAILMGLLLILAMIQRRNPEKQPHHVDLPNKAFHQGLIVLFFAYFLWALFAQNIEKPRHLSPLIGLFVFLTYFPLFKKQATYNLHGRKSNLVSILKVVLIMLLIGLQVLNGLQLSKKQASEVPAAYQLSYYLEKIEEEFIVYTWEETRVMQYIDVSYPNKRIVTYDYFLQEIKKKEGQRIFLTNHLLQGFKDQGINITNKAKKIAVFSSDPLFDPVYHEIILYEWLKCPED